MKSRIAYALSLGIILTSHSTCLAADDSELQQGLSDYRHHDYQEALGPGPGHGPDLGGPPPPGFGLPPTCAPHPGFGLPIGPPPPFGGPPPFIHGLRGGMIGPTPGGGPGGAPDAVPDAAKRNADRDRLSNLIRFGWWQPELAG